MYVFHEFFDVGFRAILVYKDLPGWHQNFNPGEITPSYILHTRAFGTYLLGGLFTLQKILYGDGILHVNNLKILYVMVFYI